MLYILCECPIYIDFIGLSQEWNYFLEIQPNVMKDIIYIKKEDKDKYFCFSSFGYKSSSGLPLKTKDIYEIEQYLYRFCANVLLTKGVLHFHSAFVLYKGRALIFTGPSGIGKTTQAELWRDYQEALIVNGDASLLRRMDDGRWWAFGTPVHGSSPYCENEKAPIAAIIALEQGKDNVLTPMDNFSALSACVPEFYRPRLDEAAEETFWNSVDALFEAVPVYHLTCRPDREATELVKKELLKIE